MKNKIKVSFLFMSLLVALSTECKEAVISRLSNPVGVCQDLGLNVSGKNTQRALCTAVLAVIKFLEEVNKRENSLK